MGLPTPSGQGSRARCQQQHAGHPEGPHLSSALLSLSLRGPRLTRPKPVSRNAGLCHPNSGHKSLQATVLSAYAMGTKPFLPSLPV